MIERNQRGRRVHKSTESLKRKEDNFSNHTKLEVKTSIKAMLAYDRLSPKERRQVRTVIEELKRGHEFALRREKISNASRTLYSGRINKNLRVIYRYKDEHSIEIVGFIDRRENLKMTRVRTE
ncbi:hypothetical protein [Vibrio alginolyticus]|uniref:hypothetical protein n=1 Tax=Vibrio alginolyticus TaxID=663 RepID=UPI00215F125F|nr:hypothetical protein [Vibrio alginolyticus]ELB2895534.1 hypothetical protein [Vibrio alginolyticus]MCS0201749.1 hypothetical protein [Vibrio alginolyticus]